MALISPPILILPPLICKDSSGFSVLIPILLFEVSIHIKLFGSGL